MQNKNSLKCCGLVNNFIFVALTGILFCGFVGVATDSPSERGSHNASQYVIDTSKGSLTACIELNAIANEIEISESAIKRAFSKVNGFVPFSDADDGESPTYCALKLV